MKAKELSKKLNSISKKLNKLDGEMDVWITDRFSRVAKNLGEIDIFVAKYPFSKESHVTIRYH